MHFSMKTYDSNNKDFVSDYRLTKSAFMIVIIEHLYLKRILKKGNTALFLFGQDNAHMLTQSPKKIR